ncbi:mutS protein homolog 4-like [Eriocheir sinensis]|uniref:mutS protein homolog 4-like n=1 Tax=Eriocheir sinensis TaxID=95602 RepID=UPI0021C70356|nr:mutS protein homolog 4-like [Eriocheir sinensis]
MYFVPRNLAKTPKYDIYEHYEGEEGSYTAIAAAGMGGHHVPSLSRGVGRGRGRGTPVCSSSTLSTPVFSYSTPSTPVIGPSTPVSTPIMSFSTKLSTSEDSRQFSTPPVGPRTPSTDLSTSKDSRQLSTPPAGLLPRTPSTALSNVSTLSSMYSTPLSTTLPPPLARFSSSIFPSPSPPSSSTSSSYRGRGGRGGIYRGNYDTKFQYSQTSPCGTPVCSATTLSTPSTPVIGPSTPVSTPIMSFSTKLRTSEDSRQLSTPPVGPRTPRTDLSNLSTSKDARQLSTPPAGLLPRTPSTALSNVSTLSSRTPGSARSSSRRTPSSTRSSRTPGSACSITMTPMSATQQLPPSTIVAVVEGRGQAQGEVGLAAVDLRRPQITLAQFSDTHTYTHTLTKLGLLNPLEVVVATTAARAECEGAAGGGGRGGRGGRGLLRMVQESLADVSVTAIQRRYFNDARGLATIKHLAAPHCAYVERQVANRYYCLASVAALMKYVELVQHVTYAPHSLHVELTSSEDTMNLDFWSWRALEVVRSLQGEWQDSLFGALRHTRTPAGTRKLRATLLQPFSNPVTINARLDSLEYLAQNPDLFHTLQSILGRFPDIDWLLSMCVQMPKEDTEQRSEQRLNYVIGLKNTLELLEPLGMALVAVADPFLASIRETVGHEGLQELLEVLRGVLHEDARLVKGAAAMRTLRCYAIRNGVNGLLDVARKIYSEIIDDITESVAAVGKQYGVPVRVGHNAALGFHIIIPVAKRSKPPALPKTFIKVQRGRGCLSCTTELVYQLDQRARDIVREILVMSNVIVQEVLGEARSKIGVLHDLGEAVATLDLVVALAHVAALGSWVRPEFSHTMAIRGGRHPILDLLSPTPPVPNNSFLGPGSLLMVVTGPNMSGKSTYLRQIALIQVLAQIGSFVPAEMASLRPVTKLFTHLGSEDRPEANESTFQVQMNEVAHMMVGTEEILLGGGGRREGGGGGERGGGGGGGGGGESGTGSRGGAGPDSLVVLDELGSGTSLEEGGALAWAVVEALTRLGATTVLVTHTLFLTRLAALYPNVTNYHMESLESAGGRLQLTHMLRKGVTRTTHYGLSLAALTPLPPSVLERARHLAHAMAPPTKVSVTDNNEEAEIEESRHAVYRLAHRLMALASTLPTPTPTPASTPATPTHPNTAHTPADTTHVPSPPSPRLVGHGVTSLSPSDDPARPESVSPSQECSADPILTCDSSVGSAKNASAALMPCTGGFDPKLGGFDPILTCDPIPASANNASTTQVMPCTSGFDPMLACESVSGNVTNPNITQLIPCNSGFNPIPACDFIPGIANDGNTAQLVPYSSGSEDTTSISRSLPRQENITGTSHGLQDQGNITAATPGLKDQQNIIGSHDLQDHNITATSNGFQEQNITDTSHSLQGPENITSASRINTSHGSHHQGNITGTSHELQDQQNITLGSPINTSQGISTPSTSSTNLRTNTLIQEELSAMGVGAGARAGGQGTEELRAQLEALRRDFLAKVARSDLQRVMSGAPRLC